MESEVLPGFFVIDHSLRHSGDHHFDLVWSLAAAGQARGLQTTIGTHATFRESIPGLNDGQMRRVFRDTMYQPLSRLAGLQKMSRARTNSGQSPRQGLSGWWQRCRSAWVHRQQLRQTNAFARRFAEDCQRFFRGESLCEGDHVLLATVSELELAGLAEFLKRVPNTQEAQWHLCFHFPLLSGRPPEYSRQSQRIDEVREFLMQHLRRIPCHRLHFYCTTESLADQYNRLGLVRFQSLPYPLSPHLWDEGNENAITANQNSLPNTSAPCNNLASSFSTAILDCLDNNNAAWLPRRSEPLRLSSLGAVRREKQQQASLQPMIDQLWQPWLASNQLQLQFQQPRRPWPAPRKLKWRAPPQVALDDLNRQLIDWPHPLPTREYRQLLEQTDCGLLLYDGEVYFARRAGILGELLALGKPVIVSAGSWLHEQIKDVQFTYHDWLLENTGVRRVLTLEQLGWNSRNIPLPGGVITFDRGQHPFELQIPLTSEEHGVVIKFLWHCPTTPGVYCQFSPEVPDCLESVIGHRSGGGESSVFVPVSRHQGRLTVKLTNAFQESAASIMGISVHTLDKTCLQRPQGVVGIAIAQQRQLGAAVSEWIRNETHYRATATAFGGVWRQQNHPDQIVGKLWQTARQLTRAA